MSQTRVIDGVRVTRRPGGWQFHRRSATRLANQAHGPDLPGLSSTSRRMSPQDREQLKALYLELEVRGAFTTDDPAAARARFEPVAVLERDPTPRPADWGAGGPGPLDLGNCLRTAVSCCWPVPPGLIPPMGDGEDPGWRGPFLAGLRRAGLHLQVASEPPKSGRYVAVVRTPDGLHAVAMEINHRGEHLVLHDPGRFLRRGDRLDTATVSYYFKPKVMVDRWGRRLAA